MSMEVSCDVVESTVDLKLKQKVRFGAATKERDDYSLDATLRH